MSYKSAGMEHIKADDQFYVLATSSLTEEKTFTLKHNEAFGIFNKYGDILPFEKSVQGLFFEGTRYLSGLQLKIENEKPLYLSSDVKEGNELFSIDLTNPDIIEENKLRLEKGLIHIRRKKVLWEGVYYEQISFFNYGLAEIKFNTSISFEARFDDIFEVRGTERKKRGRKLPLILEKNHILLGYIGLDQIERTSEIILEPLPEVINHKTAYYNLELKPGESQIVTISVSFLNSNVKIRSTIGFLSAVKKIKRQLDYINKNACEVYTSNEQFNQWIKQSKADLITMISETPSGPYPYAGIPWYSTPFGRDGIITAFECLWIAPEVAKGVLMFLASTQAQIHDTFRDAEPGKILHEARKGEMAELNEIPFRQYYGTIDATPLFVVLAGAYYVRTADILTIRELWPNIESALNWIKQYGDIDGDMFVEYVRKEETGLFNQGWKDSHDSVSYSDGTIADPPIALCEVQGYVYDAWMKASLLAEALGLKEKAWEWTAYALELKMKFSKSFWSQKKSTYYLAITSGKNPCDVIASNAGHCLFSGIATQDEAQKIANNLLSPHMFTGWGIRTLDAREKRYNPMSYHNGSVWPHDNALIAYGFSRYGLKDEINKVTTGLFNASLFIENQRLPELFCGFKKRPGEPPTAYPVACSPQAWSVASVFMLIQAFLGMEIIENENLIRFYKPNLPEFIDDLKIKNLKFKDQLLNFQFTKTADGVSIGLLNKDVSIRLETIY
jgi:glycogen debranching enzyme